ncbi:MAG: serine/threonine protein kinase [Heteroscytonema crispum UTEX LB 1556]
MSNFPDFSSHGYQVNRELGRNREGGRITWLATNLQISEEVVLKQFCFAQAGSSWSGLNAYDREIQVLQGLNHPGIPSYLDAFETQDGFCIVQEYKNAPTLAVKRSFEPEEIKEIAVKILEILVDLQNRIPPVIHRDIKPENILVDAKLNVYLIDFGFARIGSEEVSGSSVFKGTPGFIAPEQLFKPTEASDLYSLGTTLICLLTGKRATDIQDLVDNDDPYLLHFKHLLPRLSLRFIDWLEKMVQPRQKDRFKNAETALEALKPLYVIRIPEVKLSKSILEFKANYLGETLIERIIINNSIPETVLEGRWEVAPHKSDPPHRPNSHAWISLEKREFKSNSVECGIIVDTRQLMADKVYERKILLHTNSSPETSELTVRIQTAKIPLEIAKIPYVSLFGLLVTSGTVVGGFLVAAPAFVSGIMSLVTVTALLISFGGGFEFVIGFAVVMLIVGSMLQFVLQTPTVVGLATGALIGLLVGFVFGQPGAGIDSKIKTKALENVQNVTSTVGAVLGVVVGGGSGAVAGNILGNTYWAVLGALAVSTLLVFVVAYVAGIVSKNVVERGFNKGFAILILLLTAGLGITTGIGLKVGLLHQLVISVMALTGVPLASMLIYLPLNRRRLIGKYRDSEQHLIKP